jgi:mRNA interferase HicA
VKRRDLERHLASRGCEVLREGGGHAIWRNPATSARAPVPRHREIKPTLVRAICAQLGVPSPPSVS